MRYNTYMKKTIVALTLVAMTATSAFARDITVSFTDGSKHIYNNAPEATTMEQVQTRIVKDFPSKTVVQLDGVRATEPTLPVSAPGASDNGYCSSGWALVGCLVAGVVVVAVMAPLLTGVAAAGGCQHASDRASDGSRCGGRSADSRPGGR